MKVEMEVLQEFTLPIKRVRFAVEVDIERVTAVEDEIASTWKMKGFRTGSAPVGIVHETMERELTERHMEPFSSPRLIFIEPKEAGAIAFLVVMDATERAREHEGNEPHDLAGPDLSDESQPSQELSIVPNDGDLPAEGA
jgi:hypothetical protein